MTESRTQTSLVALAPSGATIKVCAATEVDAALVAEALHEARPSWRVTIDNHEIVFSREGKVVDFVQARGCSVGGR
jgi:hypothetical protein